MSIKLKLIERNMEKKKKLKNVTHCLFISQIKKIYGAPGQQNLSYCINRLIRKERKSRKKEKENEKDNKQSRNKERKKDIKKNREKKMRRDEIDSMRKIEKKGKRKKTINHEGKKKSR